MSLNDSPAAVLSTLGSPARRTIAHGNGSPDWTYSGVRVQFLTERTGPQVANIALQSRTAGQTDKGIRVGDPASRVLSAYGTGLIDDKEGSLMVPVDPTTRLTFEIDAHASVSAISMRRLDCDTCVPIVHTGPGPKKP